IPSGVIGFLTVGPMLFGTDMMGHAEQLPFFLGAIDVAAARDVVAQVGEEVWHGPVAFALHGFKAPTFWLAFAGFLLATLMYLWKPELHGKARRLFALPVRILEDKYGFDRLWIQGFAGGGLLLGRGSRQVDEKLIDGFFVNGSTRAVAAGAALLRKSQSGYLYHYAFAMILGVIALLGVLLWLWNSPMTPNGSFPLLSLLVWLPIIGGSLVLLLVNARPQAARWTGLAFAAATLAASIPLFTGFDFANPGMQFVEQHAWIPAYDIQYHLGADGISVALIGLTTLTTLLVLVGAWSPIQSRVGQYV